jgi:hypothetical protein
MIIYYNFKNYEMCYNRRVRIISGNWEDVEILLWKDIVIFFVWVIVRGCQQRDYEIVSNGWMSDEFERIWKEAVVA